MSIDVQYAARLQSRAAARQREKSVCGGDSTVPAWLRVRVPAHADPHAVEVQLVRAINSSGERSLTAELVLVPMLCGASRGASCVLTYAVVLQSTPAESRLGGDELVAAASSAARTAVHRLFGAQAAAAARRARNMGELAACHRAMHGTPRRLLD